MLSFKCPGCQLVLRAPEEKAGAVTNCPRCRQALRVPAAPPASPPRPPAPDEKGWYIIRDNRRWGPVSWDQLRRQAVAGQLLATDQVWTPGMGRSIEARTLPGLIPESPSSVPGAAGPESSPDRDRPPLWKRGLHEVQEIGLATLRQTVRPVLHLKNVWRRRSLQQTAAAAQTTLGQKLYEARAGDPQLREQIRGLGEQINSAAVSGTKTPRLVAERRQLLLRLADPFLDRPAPPPPIAEAHQQARAARDLLRSHEARMKAAGGPLLPAGWVGWRRVGIGYGVLAAAAVGVFFLVAHPRHRVAAPPESAAVPAQKVADKEAKPLPDLTPKEIYAASAPSVALLRTGKAGGTGFLVKPNILVTNAHVIDIAPITELKVFFPSAGEAGKNPLGAKLLYFDGRRDLALLEVKTSLKPLPILDDYRFQGGQDVTVIGSPGIGKGTLENAVTGGLMSTRTKLRGQDYYQLSISVNPGNSGGPVFDAKGRVIGVVTLKASRQEGIAFCVPARDLVRALKAQGCQSQEQQAEMAARHNLVVLVRRISLAGSIYAKGLELYQRCLQESRFQPQLVTRKLAQIHSSFDKVKNIDQALLGEARSLVTQVASDTNLPVSQRQELTNLWTNYLEMKNYFNKPRGTISGLAIKLNELRDKHKNLVESLRVSLGLDELDTLTEDDD
jgi:hypothetical protein